MEQISGTIPAAPTQQDSRPAEEGPADLSGFRARGRMRRRARFLRKARELAYRDLGGLVFNLHRFGQRNDELVLAKLGVLGAIDEELRKLEAALGEREPTTVLREAGITACPRCAAIHAGEDRYCPNCGLSLGRHPDLPVAVTPGAGAPVPPANGPSTPVVPAGAAANGETISPPAAPVEVPETTQVVHPTASGA